MVILTPPAPINKITDMTKGLTLFIDSFSFVSPIQWPLYSLVFSNNDFYLLSLSYSRSAFNCYLFLLRSVKIGGAEYEVSSQLIRLEFKFIMGIKRAVTLDEGSKSQWLGISSPRKLTVSLGALMLIFLIFMIGYAMAEKYSEHISNQEKETESWDHCLHQYVQKVCSPKTRKEGTTGQKECENFRNCLVKGIKKISLTEIVFQSLKETGSTYGIIAITIIFLIRMI